MAAAFRKAKRNCWRCRASAPIRRRRSVAIAFDRPATAVDGNIERVVARLFAVREPLPGRQGGNQTAGGDVDARATPRRLYAGHDGSWRDHMLAAFTVLRALSAIGRLPCRTARDRCLAAGESTKEGAPAQARHGLCRHARGWRGAAAAARHRKVCSAGCWKCLRPNGWRDPPSRAIARRRCAPPAEWRRIGGTVSHTFTHFHLELEVYLARNVAAGVYPKGCAWYPRAVLHDEALPSVMRKVLAHALPEGRDLRPERMNSRSCSDRWRLKIRKVIEIGNTTNLVAPAFQPEPTVFVIPGLQPLCCPGRREAVSRDPIPLPQLHCRNFTMNRPRLWRPGRRKMQYLYCRAEAVRLKAS